MQVKLIPFIVTQIAKRIAPLPIAKASSLVEWDDKDALTIQINYNCLNNDVVSNVQSKNTSHDVQQELTKNLKVKM